MAARNRQDQKLHSSNGAELGVLGDEYNKSPCREGRPRLLKDKTHHPTTPPGIFSRVLCISVRMRDSLLDSRKLRVRIKDNKKSPHGKFHRLLFPFSSTFSDLNFSTYVLYNLPALCHVSQTVSLGYLCAHLFDF